jgi:alanine racemase
LARALDRQARKHHRPIDIHVEIDTGMGRLGVWHEEATDFIGQLMRFPNLSIKGLYTHFPVAESDRNFTENQINHLYRVVTSLDKKGLVIPYIHAANSMGLYGYRTRILNLVRPGLMLYGLYPQPQLKKMIDLKPVLSVKSKIMFIKKVAKGRSISYGRTFIARKDMTVATLPIGYRDGYFRSLSNQAFVIVAGYRCPIVGRVTMDQIMIDVSRVRGIKLGMNVTVLGREKKAEVSADELAALAGTINYEIVTSLGNRLPRIYKATKISS